MSLTHPPSGILLIAGCGVAIAGPILACMAIGHSVWIGTLLGLIIAARLTLRAIEAWDCAATSACAAPECPYCDCGESWTTKALHRGDLAAIKDRVLADPTYCTSAEINVVATPLRLAVSHGELDLVTFMLEHGADPTTECDGGASCLMAAISLERPCSVEILSKLIEAGVNVRFNGYGGWLCTPLHWAADTGDVDKARILLDAGACIDERTEDLDGDTALMKAASCGRAEMVHLLLERGADPTMQDGCGGTALKLATYAADLSFQEKCLESMKNTHEQSVEMLANRGLKLTRSMRKYLKSEYEKDREKHRQKSYELATSDRLQEVIRVLSEVTPHTI